MSVHPSQLALERHALSELPRGARAELERHLADCPRCRDRLAALRADDERFAAGPGQGPALDRALDALAAAAAPPRPRRWRRATLAAGALAVATALAILVWPAPPRDLDGRRKGGGVRLEVVRRTPAGAQQWLERDPRVHPGDAIRFRVSSPTAGYVAVLGLDAQRARREAKGMACASVPADSSKRSSGPSARRRWRCHTARRGG